MAITKQEIDSIDATPTKRIYRSIIADYGLKTAICELIDNSIDVWNSISGGPDLKIEVDIDVDQQRIIISDNAGGVKEKELKKLISPGESTISGLENSIGIFGVGSKRAVVALAQLVRITTRHRRSNTFRLEYDDEWLTSDEWSLPYHRVGAIKPSNTRIDLSNLRFKIEEQDVKSLKTHLSETYSHFIKNGKIAILLNTDLINAKYFENWAFPPEYSPKSFTKTIKVRGKKKNIKFNLTAGLTIEGGSIAGDYGVFFYCNKRLIAKALKSNEVGFVSGIAGIPHPKMSLARIIVKLDGPSDHMPWTSNKANINYNHYIFQNIKGDIIQAVKTYTGISKRLHPEFKEKVLPYEIGMIANERLVKNEGIVPSKLPKIPKARLDYKSQIIELNKKLCKHKPWVRGLYEGVIAEEVISRQKSLEQKNRIQLIILDSTLEIAFKDYLANETKQPFGDPKLEKLFGNRIAVHKEVEKHLFTGKPIWATINYFYKMRCDLIHRKANVSISDDNIKTYRKIVKKILSKAFGAKFPINN